MSVSGKIENYKAIAIFQANEVNETMIHCMFVYFEQQFQAFYSIIICSRSVAYNGLCGSQCRDVLLSIHERLIHEWAVESSVKMNWFDTVEAVPDPVKSVMSMHRIF